MGVFDRRGKTGASQTPMDEAVPFLTKADADHLRSLVAKEFRKRGVAVAVFDDHFEAPDGGAYGLWNIAASCHNAANGRREWPALARRHVSALLAPTPEFEDISDSDLLASVYARVYGVETIPPALLENLTYGIPLADGLVEILVLDTPESVVTLGDSQLAGRDREALWAAGRARARTAEIDEIEWIENKDHGKFAVALGESVYTASRILDVPSLLARIFGERGFPNGVVIAVPHRHQILAHAIDDLGAVVMINHLARFALLGYQEGVGGVSPDAFWWDGERLSRISQVGDDGSITVLAGPEFTEVLNRLQPR